MFRQRRAVCQGFANLLQVMLHTQGIPALGIIGYYGRLGAHAWNYVYTGTWRVSDPTNGGDWPMESYKDYAFLDPITIDAPLCATGQIVCDYRQRHLNIREIKPDAPSPVFAVPYSICGMRITSLNPQVPLPDGIKQLAIGKNILTLGTEDDRGLSIQAPLLGKIWVEAENPALQSSAGAVYRISESGPALEYVPLGITRLELLPLKAIGKNAVFNHPALEQVIIATGTQTIEDYAFEKCPKLKEARVPQGVTVAPQAFCEVHPDFKISWVTPGKSSYNAAGAI